METVLVHTKQNGADGRAVFDIMRLSSHGPQAVIYRLGEHLHLAALNPSKLRRVKGRKYDWLYEDFVYLQPQDEARTVTFGEGFYRLQAFVRHRGENKILVLPMQIIGRTIRAVIEWMVEFDQTDRQVKDSIELDPRQIQRIPPTMGADFLYQKGLEVPDSVELSPPRTLDQTEE